MGLEDAAPLLSRPTATHFRAAARAKRPSIRQGCALRTRAASSNGKTRQKCAQKKAFDLLTSNSSSTGAASCGRSQQTVWLVNT